MKNILVPTDLSAYAHHAIRYAINMAGKSQSKLLFQLAGASDEHDVKAQAIKLVSDIAGKLQTNFNITGVEFIISNAALSNKLIKDTIDKYDIHLAVIYPDHENPKSAFYGGHISELINEVSCPVLWSPHGYANLNIERIAYATELHDLKKRIVKIIPFARMFGATIEAFHVYPVFPLIVDVEKYNVEKKLARLRELTAYDKINIHFVKTPFSNEPVAGIRQFVEENKPDMLIMFHKPRGLFDKLFFDSGATPAVAKISPVPLLAVNKKTAFKIM